MQRMKQIFNENHKFLNGNYSNADHAKEFHRHRWYFFKEGFSPLIVEEAITEAGLNKNDLIVDPFAGSGTVPLVASANGHHGVGFEVNPFMAFVAGSKQSKISPTRYSKYKDTILDSIEKGERSYLENYSTFSETYNKKKWLFNTGVLRAFEGGWKGTEKLPYDVRKLYRLNLLASIMDNSNASRDGKCLRYKKNWENIRYSKDSFIESFLERFEQVKDDLYDFPIASAKTKIYRGDSRKLLKHKLHKPFKLCITSPPYLNSFDYSDIYRPELFLGKFVKTNKDLKKLRLQTVRSHVQVAWPRPKKNDFGYLYKQSIEEINRRSEILWNKKIPLMIRAYFEDMEKVLVDLKFSASKDAFIWIVVSTSSYVGVEVPVDLILADIGTKVGWKLQEIIVTRYLRHSTQNAQRWLSGEAKTRRLRESIIIFKGYNR